MSFPLVDDLVNVTEFKQLCQDIRGFGYESEVHQIFVTPPPQSLAISMPCPMSQGYHAMTERNSVIDSDWVDCRRNCQKKKMSQGYHAMTMTFGACLCTATSPHHLVLSCSVARLPCYDKGGGSQGFCTMTAPPYWHCPLGLITALLCKWHVW